ncbi:MAG: VanZ family protein [Chloroflexota bacterium]
MTVFSSKRERRLWLWTLAIVIAIYSTLGLAAMLAEVLSNRGLIDTFFALGFLLVIATALTQGMKARPSGVEIAVALGVSAAYIMTFVRMGIPAAERTHLIEYGVVAIFIYEALIERASQGRDVPVPAILGVLAASLLGVLDELIQAWLPSRVFDPVDILFNILAAIMAVAASAALGWARQWRSKNQ